MTTKKTIVGYAIIIAERQRGEGIEINTTYFKADEYTEARDYYAESVRDLEVKYPDCGEPEMYVSNNTCYCESQPDVYNNCYSVQLEDIVL